MLLVADNSAHTNISVDGTGDIATLIDGAGDVFSITAGGKAVVVSGDTAVDTGTADDENLYIFLHDANGDGDHVEYFSLVRRWANEAALPRGLSSVINSTHAKPYNTSLPNHHSRRFVG
ncbi:hypothetical protein N9M37_05170 [Planktomarina temperata]|nr:hypothetical protein [Planktomarina temperata]